MDRHIQAVRHLLAHLNDVAALRANQIAAGLFDSDLPAGTVHGQIRGLVARALDTVTAQHAKSAKAVHGARLRAIVERCDLEGEPHTKVADELGLSDRQFYRERRYAIEALAPAVLEQVRALHRREEHIPAEAELLIEFAGNLDCIGRLDKAASVLEDFLSSRPGRPLMELSAITHLIDIYQRLGRVGELTELVDMAAAVRAHLSAADPTADAELDIARALASAAQENLTGYAEYLQHAISLLPHFSAHAEGRGFELAVRAVLDLAYLYIISGSPARGERLIELAEDLFGRGNADRHRAYFFHVRSSLALTRGDTTRGAADSNASFSAARTRQLSELMMHASQNLSVASLYSRDWDTARRYSRNALLLADLLDMERNHRLAALITLAQIEIDSGRPFEALEYCKAAETSAARDSVSTQVSRLVQAEAMLQTGQVTLAAALADAATANVVDHGYQRFSGYAKRVRAEILYQQNLRSLALQEIDDAIDLLRAHGTVYSLQQAYATSARISGNRSHGRIAVEMASAMSMTR